MAKRGVVKVDFYFDDFIAGVTHLEPEERGVYITLCALFWSREGALPDDDQANARACNTSTRTYRRIKAALADKRKLQIEGGMISQRRAGDEYQAARQRIDQFVAAGAAGGAAKAERERAEQERQKKSEKTAEKTAKLSGSEDGNVRDNNDPSLASPPYPLSTTLSKDEEPNGSVGSAAPKPTVVKSFKPHVEAIWEATSRRGRERSSRKDIERALAAATRRGHDPLAVEAGVIAYNRSEPATKDGGEYAKGPHRIIENDRWQAFTEGAASFADSRVARWDSDTWRAALRGFRDSGRWSDAMGPPPGKAGCGAPAPVLAEFGFSEERAA